MVEIPKVREGRVMKELAEEQSKDKTLKKGFSWDNDILYKTVLDDIQGEMKLILVPRQKRNKILTLAHEKSGHLGYRKKTLLLGIYGARDNQPYKYCDMCARCNTSGRRELLYK